MSRQRSNFLSCLGTLFSIFQKVVAKFLECGGTDEQIESVNKDLDLQRKLAWVLTGKCGIIYFDDDTSFGRFVKYGTRVICWYPWFNADQQRAGNHFYLGQKVVFRNQGINGYVVSISNPKDEFKTIGILFLGEAEIRHCFIDEVRDPNW